MALIYITGAPGIGKSTLQKELSSRGYETHDMDDPDMGGPHNKLSGERVTIPPAEQRPPDYFDDLEWRIYSNAIKELKTRADEKNIFVCGVAESDGEILFIFDKTIYLSLDEDSLVDRIRSRVNNDFGKNDSELETILRRKQGLDERYVLLGVATLDASGTVAEVADSILTHI